MKNPSDQPKRNNNLWKIKKLFFGVHNFALQIFEVLIFFFFLMFLTLFPLYTSWFGNLICSIYMRYKRTKKKQMNNENENCVNLQITRADAW